jgi:hypothetical protein
MDVARAENIRVVGLNVPRDIPRAVNRGGLAGLSDEQRELVGEGTTDGSPAHRYLIGRYFGETVAMLPPGWFDNMYSAQCLWDVVMARSILANLEAGETMVVIVGSGHVAYDLGIGRRIHEELSSSSQSDVAVATFCPVTAPPPDPEGEADGHPMGGHGNGMAGAAAKPARFVRSLSDYVGVFSDTGGVEAFPRVGLRLDEGDDGNPVVSMAWPDTPAAAAGFEHGDRIVSFNGHPTANLTELRLQLAETTWGQRVDFGVEREEETLEIPLLLYPEVDLTEDVTAPGFSVEAALEVDPLSSEAVAADTEAAERPRAVLVSKGSAPLRVEVWHGDVLEAVHELDSSGRVERSLHRMPRSDGAVELRYRRDELGNVTEVERLDAIGESIGG